MWTDQPMKKAFMVSEENPLLDKKLFILGAQMRKILSYVPHTLQIVIFSKENSICFSCLVAWFQK